MRRPCARPLVNGENLSWVDARNRFVYVEAQLDRWSGACRSTDRRGLGGHSLGCGGEHGSGENHARAARKLFPVRTQNALRDNLIGLLRGCMSRQRQVPQTEVQ